MHSTFYLTVALSAIACAHPSLVARVTSPSTEDPNAWTPTLRDYFEAVGAHVETIRDAPSFPGPPACNVQTAVMPTLSPSASASASVTPLPTPSAGLNPVHVAIGRGTQNYTCADSTSGSTPVQVGALASLYNASCVAANYPDLLAMMPNVTLGFAIPSGTDPLFPSDIVLSGHHFFADATTPTFDMDSATDSFGTCPTAKKGSIPAPASSMKGQNGTGFGSVPWLQLSAKTNSTMFKEVYRVNTAGGNPPPTCEGMASAFEIQYAAEYWFFA